MSNPLAWQDTFTTAHAALSNLTTALDELNAVRNESLSALAGIGERRGLNVNLDAAEATFNRPYTIVPTNDPNEILVVQSLVVADLPAVGWILSDDGAFRVSRVTRTMNLMGSLPAWVQQEGGWAPPEHTATVDPVTGVVNVTAGDRATFRERYGRFLGKPNAQGYTLKSPQGFIGLIAQLMRDGISPHVPRPLDPADWDDSAECDIELRDYQESALATFRQFSGVTMFAPTGAGKMFAALYPIAHLRCGGYILVPNITLAEEWQRNIALYAPKLRGRVVTYAWAFAHLQELQRDPNIKWLVFDEMHHLPAKEWSRLAFIRNRAEIYTIGATATPYREDGLTYMIMALCGPVAAVPWQPLIARGILNKPKAEVRIYDDEARKFRELQMILAAHPNERIFIYCETRDKGKELSRALGLPFVSGEVHANRRALVESSKHCILSVVGQLGISFKDLRMVIEYDVSRTGKSRTTALQYHGRLMHSLLKNTLYLVLFTLAEYHKFGDRLNGIRQELGDVQIADLTGKAGKPHTDKPRRVRTVARVAPAVKAGDECGAALASKAIARLILDHERNLGATRRGYMPRVFRILWRFDGTSEDLRLREGKSVKSWEPYQAALNMLVKAGLARKVENRYYLDKARVNALRG